MEALLGRLAIHYGFVTHEQLAEATRLQARRADGVRLGQVLVELGAMRLEQLDELLALQRKYLQSRPRLGPELDAQALPPRNGGSDPEPAPVPVAIGAAAIVKRRRIVGPVEEAPPREAAHAVEESAPEREAGPEPDEIAWIVPSREHVPDPVALCVLDAFRLGASDVHAHAGAPLRVRLHGRLTQFGEDALRPEVLERAARAMLTEAEWARLQTDGQVDFVHTVPAVGRVRGNAYRQIRGVDVVLRLVPVLPPTLAQLGLPTHLARLTNHDRGLVVVTGPAGSGKSATIAAFVDLINEERAAHVMCVEHPLEHVHASKRSLVNQRSIGAQPDAYARAVRAAMRGDPDVIVIGELRDGETIALALAAAEAGHLVLATLETTHVVGAIQRLEHAFPPAQQGQIRARLADNLRAVLTQRLVRNAAGDGRVLAHGLLVVDASVGALIREGRLAQIDAAVRGGQAKGSVRLEDTLVSLVQRGVVAPQEARRHLPEARAVAEAS
jgi:twitching motility protein PilT